MPELAIRRATAYDVVPIGALIDAAYAPWKARLPDLPDVSSGVAEDISTGTAWVAVQQDRIVGVLLASLEGRVFHIANLAVDPAAAGSGIGTRLVRRADAEARETGCFWLHLATHREMTGNVAFYERLGWHVSDRDGSKVVMVKHLTDD